MRPRLLPASPLIFFVAACDTGTNLVPQKRIIDSFPMVDCGVVAPLDRQVCSIPIFSEGDGRALIYEIRSSDVDIPDGGALDSGAFIVTPEDWQDPECSPNGTCRQLEGYDDESDDDTFLLPVAFAPQVIGEYNAVLTIWTNDTTESGDDALEPMPDDPDTEHSVWKVQLRGLSRNPCGRVWPPFIDFGKRASGGNFYESATLDNCGIVSVQVGGAQGAGTGSTEMTISNSWPLYNLPGLTEELLVSWVVGPQQDLDGDGLADPVPKETTFTLSSNSETLDGSTLTVIGNDCEQSVDPSWDADRDGWTVCGGDCDDTDATINPSQPERASTGEDENCDGDIDEAANPQGADGDGDGYSEIAGDCNDADATMFPGATESANAMDDDCNDVVDNGTDRYDDDGDGYSEREGDCDDTSRLVSPAITETTDGVDNDCDDIVDEGGQTYDDDEDGFADIDAVADDCDDHDPWVYVGAYEYCDGYDNDCDGVTDEGPEDEADGACSFLPERRGEDATDADAASQDPGGCSTAPGAPFGALLALAAAVGATRRRR